MAAHPLSLALSAARYANFELGQDMQASSSNIKQQRFAAILSASVVDFFDNIVDEKENDSLVVVCKSRASCMLRLKYDSFKSIVHRFSSAFSWPSNKLSHAGHETGYAEVCSP